jgi:hypothetical protein
MVLSSMDISSLVQWRAVQAVEVAEYCGGPTEARAGLEDTCIANRAPDGPADCMSCEYSVRTG